MNKDFEEKPYHGAIFLSSREENILTIKSFATLNFNFSLAKHYLIDESGSYSLSLRQNKLFVDHDNQINIYNEAINFNLHVEDNPPVVTYAESSQKLSKSNLKCKNFGNNHCVYNSFNNKQVDDIKQAHYYAENTLSYLANNLSNPLSESYKFAYQELFCKDHYSTLNDVINSYKLMHNFIRSGMKYWLNGQECRPNDYGYIFQGTKGKNMYLCQLYIEAEPFPNSINCCDSKAGILIHEVSHQAAETEDYFYSYKNCSEEALICNPQTAKNADCIQFFAEIISLQQNSYSYDEL